MEYYLLLPFAFSGGGQSGGSGGGQKFVTIGTGGVTGTYYPVGGAIGRLVNQKSDVYNARVTVESTGGSVFNINAVLAGDLDFGIAQADRQYQALEGLAEWESAGPQSDLRSVFYMYGEAVTLVASDSSGIQSIADLRDKKVNIGNVGSGQLQNARDVLEAFGIAESDIQAEFVKGSDSPSLLQDNRIDAFFYTIGHPTGVISEATSWKKQNTISIYYWTRSRCINSINSLLLKNYNTYRILSTSSKYRSRCGNNWYARNFSYECQCI